MRAKYWILPISVAALVLVVTARTKCAAAQAKSEGKRAKVNLPAAVVKAIEDNRPGAEIDKVEIETEAGITLYDIEFRAGQGEIEVAQDGTVLDVVTVIEMKDVPDAAATAIQKAADGVAIRQIEKSEVRARITKEGGKGRLSRLDIPEYVYEAELSKGEIEVAADGRIIKAPKGVVKR